MSATEYRPGDIAMVDGKPAVWEMAHPEGCWSWIDGDWTFDGEVGPVLANVNDIAAAGGVPRVEIDSELNKAATCRVTLRGRVLFQGRDYSADIVASTPPAEDTP